MKFGRSKLGISDKDIEETAALAEPLAKVSGAKTAEMVAKMSDAMLEIYLSSTKEENRPRAIRRMWEMEEWITEK